MYALLMSIESQLEGTVGDVYVLSSAGMLFLCSLVLICFLLSTLFFAKTVTLMWELDRLKRTNQVSFENVSDWISLLIEHKINISDEDFVEAVHFTSRHINKRLEDIGKDYPIDENEGREVTLPLGDDDDDSDIEDIDDVDESGEGENSEDDEEDSEENEDGHIDEDNRSYLEKKLLKGPDPDYVRS